MKRTLWNSLIFRKLLVTFLLVIAPLYGVGLLFNQQAKSSVMDGITHSMMSQVDYYLDSLETEVERMKKLQREFILDQDLQNISFTTEIMDQYTWSRTVLRIQNKLQLLKSSSIYIDNVNAYILTENRTISSNSNITKDIGSAYAELQKLQFSENTNLLYWNQKAVLRMNYPESEDENSKPYYTLDLELSFDELRRSLEQFSNYENSGAFLMIPEHEQTISSHYDHAVLQEITDSFVEYDQYKHGVLAKTAEEITYQVAYKYSPKLQLYLFIYVPEQEMLGKLDAYETWLWIFTMISLFVIIVFSNQIYRILYKPMQKLISAFGQIQKGNMHQVTLPQSKDEFSLLYQKFNSMVRQLDVLIHEVYEQKIRAQNSELKQLQSQMNPHFLYNTYFTLYRLAKIEDQENVLLFSKYLGEYFQYLTRNAAAYVPLEEEMAHTLTYINIQNIRFSNRIEVDIEELPQPARTLKVPKLILQPIVENAFKYALEQKSRDGIIRISFTLDTDYLRIRVEDNGEGLSDQDIRSLKSYLLRSGNDVENTGIRNVHRRLSIMFGGESGLQLTRASLGGLCVQLNLSRNHVGQEGERHVSDVDR